LVLLSLFSCFYSFIIVRFSLKSRIKKYICLSLTVTFAACHSDLRTSYLTV